MKPYLKMGIKFGQLLYSLRVRSVDVKGNFRTKHNNDVKCSFCSEDEYQEHLITCVKIGNNEVLYDGIKYSDIFGDDVGKNTKIAAVYNNLLEKRKSLMDQA